jgi:hypothetical protein
MIQLTLKKAVIEAMAPFTKSGQGHDPANALHILRYDDFGLQIGATDHTLTGVLRLVAGEGELLDEVLWTEDEDPILSLLVPEKAVIAALASLPADMLLKVYQTYAELGPADADGDQLGLKLPRIRTSRHVFADLQALEPAAESDVVERGQLVVPQSALNTITKAAKRLGITQPGALQLAQFRGAYGITLAGSDNFWVLLRHEVVIANALAGLPPYWVTGTAPAEERGGFSVGLLAWMQRDQAEQQTLKFPEGETTESSSDLHPLYWDEAHDDYDNLIVEAPSVICAEPGSPFYHRIVARGDEYVLASDAELLQPGDDDLYFSDLDQAKAFCQMREEEMVAAVEDETVAFDKAHADGAHGSVWVLAQVAPAGLAIDVDDVRHRWGWQEFFEMPHSDSALAKLEADDLKRMMAELEAVGMHGYHDLVDDVLRQKQTREEPVTA